MYGMSDEFDALFEENQKLKARIEDLLMSRGRLEAQLAVYMSAIASEARKGRREWARNLVKRADAAALAVKREDLVVAKVNKDA